MSQASDLLAQGQASHAEQLPAVVKIGAQSYECATSGLERDSVLGEAGFVAGRKITFWLAADAFNAAGQPIPRENTSIECTAPAAYVGAYKIDTIHPAPGGNALILRCTAPPQ